MKKSIRQLDRRLFNGLFYRLYGNHLDRRLPDPLRRLLDYQISINYRRNLTNPLSALCDLYGSDKGEITSDGNPYDWPSHTYADFYDLIFGMKKNQVHHVLECGIGTQNTNFPGTMGVNGKPGASLRVWRDYFPNAEIYGLDIDPDVIFSENRIRTFCVDQTSPESIQGFLTTLDEDTHFDIIVDDGLHEFHAGICFFETTIDRLANDGIYIIEDVAHRDRLKYEAYFREIEHQYSFRTVNLYRPNLHLGRNALVVVTKVSLT